MKKLEEKQNQMEKQLKNVTTKLEQQMKVTKVLEDKLKDGTGQLKKQEKKGE